MHRICLVTQALVWVVSLLSASVTAEEGTFEYPAYMVDIYNPDGGCWRGMAPDGHWNPPVWVVPEKWLIGPPPSQLSGVTFPDDHWVELVFSDRLVDGPGDDVIVTESGQCGEQALVFVTDGAEQEYLLGLATAPNTGVQDLTPIGFDISSIVLPFVPRAVRVAALDMGGGSPGFDIANVLARILAECRATASKPYPVDGAEGVLPDAVLNWSPGCFADKHLVYFGSVFSDVNGGAAPVSLPAQDANTFDPGTLELGKRYYWRIVEVNDPNTGNSWMGDVWTFTVADHVVLDDFESYSYPDNPVYSTWRERGRAFIALTEDPFRSCWQALTFYYYYDSVLFSEVVRSLNPPQDWASSGVNVLELSFYGDTDNSTDGQMYVIIGDANSQMTLPYEGESNKVAEEGWHTCRLDLKNLPDVNMSSISTLGIGFCCGSPEPGSFGTGKVHFDDVVLRPAVCLQDARPAADLTADCAVDFKDFEELAHDWRQSAARIVPVVAPKPPVAWYKFDGNANDSAGTSHGEVHGRPNYVQGVYGKAISFDGKSTSVVIPTAASLFGSIGNAITISFWQYGQQSSHLHDSVCCSNYSYGVSNPAIAINLGCWQLPGRFSWDCGYPWSFDNRLSGHHRSADEWSGRWNHWAFTKDTQFGGGQGRMQVFLNGILYATRTGTSSPISGITSFEIGSGWYGGYDGLVDDFRIYDYALSQFEIAHVATNGTGVFTQEISSPADLDANNKVDFRDLGDFADSWLDNGLWP